MITLKVTPLMCRGRYTPSSKAMAAPKECPVTITFLAEWAEIAFCTAARTAVAVLRNSQCMSDNFSETRISSLG